MFELNPVYTGTTILYLPSHTHTELEAHGGYCPISDTNKITFLSLLMGFNLPCLLVCYSMAQLNSSKECNIVHVQDSNSRDFLKHSFMWPATMNLLY